MEGYEGLSLFVGFRQGYNSGPARATIQVAHDTTGLVVSEDVSTPSVLHSECFIWIVNNY